MEMVPTLVQTARRGKMSRSGHPLTGKKDMGRKSSAKANTPPSAPPPSKPRAKAPAIVAGLIVVAVAVGVLTFLGDSTSSQQQAASTAPQFPDRGPIPADLKPHPQEN